jgi:hypothetical protein
MPIPSDTDCLRAAVDFPIPPDLHGFKDVFQKYLALNDELNLFVVKRQGKARNTEILQNG